MQINANSKKESHLHIVFGKLIVSLYKEKSNSSVGPPCSPMAGHKLHNIYMDHLQHIWHWPFYVNIIFFEVKMYPHTDTALGLVKAKIPKTLTALLTQNFPLQYGI